MEPTPPVAPVTSTGPPSGFMPAVSSLCTHSAAVKPAVPRIMLVRASSPSGIGTAHPAGIRIFWPNPPGVFMPRSKPMAMTASPGAKSLDDDSTTVPAASMPGVCGKLRVTPGFPVAESPSL